MRNAQHLGFRSDRIVYEIWVWDSGAGLYFLSVLSVVSFFLPQIGCCFEVDRVLAKLWNGLFGIKVRDIIL